MFPVTMLQSPFSPCFEVIVDFCLELRKRLPTLRRIVKNISG